MDGGKYSIFDSIATSYILEVGKQDEEYLSFIQRYKELSQKLYWKEHVPGKHCEQNLWLLKPANMNQGRGIKIIKNLRQLKENFGNKSSRSLWVIQKYIEKPMLYYERKFDIRVWVAVTDSADIFFYKDGYIRTSSENYDLSSTENYIHLTNNCLQIHGANYSKHEKGNTVSFDAFKEYLANDYNKSSIKPDLERDFIPRMKDLIIDTIMSIKSAIIAPNKTKGANFELLGYDFMIDEDMRTWLIEVNDNPYIGVPNEYIEGVLPKMLDSFFSIVLDEKYPPIKKLDCENRFELIYCEEGSKFSKNPINQRRSFEKGNLYPIKELEYIPPKRKEPKPLYLSSSSGNINSRMNNDSIKTKEKTEKPKEPQEEKKRLPPVPKTYRPSPPVTLEEQAEDLVKRQKLNELSSLFGKMLDVVANILQQRDSDSEKLEEDIIKV